MPCRTYLNLQTQMSKKIAFHVHGTPLFFAMQFCENKLNSNLAVHGVPMGGPCQIGQSMEALKRFFTFFDCSEPWDDLGGERSGRISGERSGKSCGELWACWGELRGELQRELGGNGDGSVDQGDLGRPRETSGLPHSSIHTFCGEAGQAESEATEYPCTRIKPKWSILKGHPLRRHTISKGPPACGNL